MKKIFFVLMALFIVITLFTTRASAAPTAMLTPTLDAPELGQLKVCKAAGAGVTVGQLFTINVNNTSYTVPAGPTDGGYCVLAGQFPLNLDVTVQEVIPAGYDVSNIEVKPDRAQNTDVESGKVIVEIGSGVTEVIFTNRASGLPTPTAGPTNTPTATPSCDPNCTPTPTPTPKGRLQICKEADGAGVSGYFSFNFANRSKTVPVGACSALITVDAGTLTISEVAQAGFKVTDVYTIPANRLISKNFDAGSATVTIVQGNASSQTIVIFRNRAESQTITPTPTGTLPTPTFTPTGTITPPTPTPTGTLATATFTPTVTGTPPTFTPTVTGTPPTPTFTPTATGTPPVCTPTVVTADFSGVGLGQSIEGMGVVAPNLNIDARGTAVKVEEATQPLIYLSPNGSGGINGGLSPGGGFSDVITKDALQAHLYTFTFAAGVSVNNFSLHMQDFGDWNPSLSTGHYASMTAYDVNGAVVSRQELSYTTPAQELPRSSNLYGDLWLTGDATTSVPGQPGNWMWRVSGNGIVRVVLEFGVGYDPNVAFDGLIYGIDCQSSCTPTVMTADFSGVGLGQSIEGMGVVAPNLNIDAKGTAVKVLEATQPLIYLSPNGSGRINGGLSPGGGFSDVTTKDALQAHLYTFTFAAGMSASDFSVHMQDFGDWNPSLSTGHYASMTAYDVNGAVVSKQELSYTTPAQELPRSSNLFGDLWLTGDATTSVLGQPGNWIWRVSGNGIVRVVLEFGVGYDPNVAFDLFYFITDCP
jgi:hypothetical protein